MTPYTQTPGPWAIDWTLSDGDRYWVEAKPGDAPIVVARVNEMRDAQLIAAAPELLAIAQGLLAIEHQCKTHGLSMLALNARAAIAKATGEKA